MKTVLEMSKLAGISIRTLHHYDAIGLLKPTEVTQAGYRLYDDAAIQRLHSILLLKELEFPLKEIKRILDTPGFDHQAALEQQIHLLELRREHIDHLIAYAKQLQENGGTYMNFSAFDTSKLDAYSQEAKERWGNTAAYQESQKRNSARSQKETAGFGQEMMVIFARFGSIRQSDPSGDEAQALAAELQQFITDHFYNCTKEIFAGLGELYTSDARFKSNIDSAGGQGTADFAAEAIRQYCKK